MDDFSTAQRTPNAYGLNGQGEANAVAPGKRMLSSMTPTLVLRDGKAWIATGSPGGSRIITAVLQNIVNIVDHGMNIAEANAAPRFHHQWLPDALEHERGFSPDTLAALRALGHQPKPANAMGSVQSVAREGDRFFGAPDPRRPGAGAFAAGD
ncbi:MAG: gamma-glutamyltransferase [Verrucomicrobiales bacterium]